MDRTVDEQSCNLLEAKYDSGTGRTALLHTAQFPMTHVNMWNYIIKSLKYHRLTSTSETGLTKDSSSSLLSSVTPQKSTDCGILDLNTTILSSVIWEDLALNSHLSSSVRDHHHRGQRQRSPSHIFCLYFFYGLSHKLGPSLVDFCWSINILEIFFRIHI